MFLGGVGHQPKKALTLDLGRRLTSSLFTTDRPLPCPSYVSSISKIRLTLSCGRQRTWTPTPTESRELFRLKGELCSLVIQNDVRLWGCTGCTHCQAEGNLKLGFIMDSIFVYRVEQHNMGPSNLFTTYIFLQILVIHWTTLSPNSNSINFDD